MGASFAHSRSYPVALLVEPQFVGMHPDDTKNVRTDSLNVLAVLSGEPGATGCSSQLEKSLSAASSNARRDLTVNTEKHMPGRRWIRCSAREFLRAAAATLGLPVMSRETWAPLERCAVRRRPAHQQARGNTFTSSEVAVRAGTVVCSPDHRQVEVDANAS